MKLSKIDEAQKLLTRWQRYRRMSDAVTIKFPAMTAYLVIDSERIEVALEDAVHLLSIEEEDLSNKASELGVEFDE